MYNEDENSSALAKLNTDSLALVCLLVALIIFCAIMYYAVLPTYKEAKIIKAGNEIKEESIEDNNLLLVRIIKANIENRKLDKESVKKIKDFIPNRNNYEDHLMHIIKLANNKNIKINDFSINENKNESKINSEDALREVEIEFATSSGFLNFISFLKSIEKSIPLVQEESIAISAKEDGNGTSESKDFGEGAEVETILDYEVKLKFYHY